MKWQTSFSKLFSVLFIGLSLCFSSSHAVEPKDVVVAQVNNRKITLEEFNRKYNEVRSQAINPPSKPQFLEDLVRYEIGLQEAERRGLEKDPIVQDRMRQELYKALLEKDLGEKVQKAEISIKEMEEYYKNNPEIRLAHILISFKPGATQVQRDEARKRATEIFNEVRSSKRSFEELVKLYSDDSLSKPNGGDVGWQSRVTLMPNVYDAALKMKVGEVRGVIETQFGFHILKVIGKRDFKHADKQQIRLAVFDEKRRQSFNEYFDRLKKSYTVRANPKALE